MFNTKIDNPSNESIFLQFGSSLENDGARFTIFSRHATLLKLHFFKNAHDEHTQKTFTLYSEQHKQGHVWSIHVPGVQAGQLYGYTVEGPWDPSRGLYFNPHKLLSDPYAKGLVGNLEDIEKNALMISPELDEDGWPRPCTKNNFATALKSVVLPSSIKPSGWQQDRRLRIPLQDSIIYEVHVRAFTQDTSSHVKFPGTYKGLVEKIPYLKELGINAVELLPIHIFNPHEISRKNPLNGEPLKQFWGYSTLNFFTPMPWYATNPQDPIAVIYEFKEMVLKLHQAGIEVILDVVYNHTAEGNQRGPVYNFKGIDNPIYYMTEHGQHYKNFSGCGNTLNCNHATVKKMILDSLHYWVLEMHIDGFRFDLATVLGRDKSGNWLPENSLLFDIAEDPILSDVKIIAEGWDGGGFFKLGEFPKGWYEWNAFFRDDIRGFIKGDSHLVSRVATRISGSSDLFYKSKAAPSYSINFITAHDGFTLYDLLSYQKKHNYNNGENNYDGNDYNLSENYGVEGHTDNSDIQAIRERQARNLIVLLMISQGTPMLLSGDEVLFSKNGNNNTYCQDNKLNWLDWTLFEKNEKFFHFVKKIIQLRKKFSSLSRPHFFQGRDTNDNSLKDITWLSPHGHELNNWNDPSLHNLAFVIDGQEDSSHKGQSHSHLYVAMNFSREKIFYRLPQLGPIKHWKTLIDTYYNPYEDFPQTPSVWLAGQDILLPPSSLVIMKHEEEKHP